MASDFFARIYKIIQRIPKGKVATYGQIAALAGKPRAARAVGWALNNTPAEMDLPWQRVINASGRSSFDEETKRKLQQALLKKEGVKFDKIGRVDLEKFQWNGK
jgi:methylated-DNA-protein-cysteine methyltransferase-like protein